MEIRDVIAALREADLELSRKVDELRLAVHVLEYRMRKVSRETEVDQGGPTQDTIPGL